MLSFMAVMARETWTDERMDDLNGRMEKGFDRVDADIRELRSEIRVHRGENKASFDRVDDEFSKMRSDMKKGFERADAKFDALQSEMNGRFDSMQRAMLIGFVTLFTGIVASIITAILAG